MRRLTCAVPVALLLAVPALAQITRVTAVRFWSVGDVTRVAIETSGEVRYRYERIENPDRLFLDLEDVLPQTGQRGIGTIPVGDRLLKQIRVARTQPGVTRVVLDLASPADYSVSQLTSPDRIIIELRVPGELQTGPPVRSVTGSHSMVETTDRPVATAEPAAAPERPLRLPPARSPTPQSLAEPPRLTAAAHVSESKVLPVPRTPAPPPPAASRKQAPPVSEPKPRRRERWPPGPTARETARSSARSG